MRHAAKCDVLHPVVLRIARAFAWFCVIALAVLSLIPKDRLIHSDGLVAVPPIPFAEHTLAYFLTGLVVAVGYSGQYRTSRLVLTLVGYAAVLELGQYLAPGRSPGLGEFGAGAVGATLGLFIGEKIWALLRSRMFAA